MGTPTKKSRLNLRIPTDLLEWAKKNAAENNTTVTQIVVGHLTKRRKAEESGDVRVAAAEQ